MLTNTNSRIVPKAWFLTILLFYMDIFYKTKIFNLAKLSALGVR